MHGRREVDLAYGRDECDDFDAERDLEILFRDGACRDTTDGLTRAAASAAATGLDAVLLEVRVVGVTGARIQVRFGVIVRALVLVLDEEGDGRAERNAMFNARLKLD